MGLCNTEDRAADVAAQREAIVAKMQKENLSEAAQAAFLANYDALCSNAATVVPEDEIESVSGITTLADLPRDEIDPDLLKETVMVKLNGGLGTGMGLDKAKSLLPVKAGETFLDIIVKQVLHMRSEVGDVQFLFMNSFSTSDDTKNHLARYEGELKQAAESLEFVQNKSPKVLQTDLGPVTYGENPAMEWCPPGHGDLYAALSGSGMLESLLNQGIKYMFVSNADNLGATMSLQILTHFAESGAPFMMEVCDRTESDKKGGHLCVSKETKQLMLRESAQCSEGDAAAFQDITKHRYFNTNNLWIRLDKLQGVMKANNGTVPLPLIKNSKTVNPKDKSSAKVYQLETAMGSAISSFEGAKAIVMPRSRFAPVKACSDLLAVRSDAYKLTDQYTLELDPSRNGMPPVIDLDGRYKLVEALDQLVPNGVPSLVKCNKLVVKGNVVFGEGVILEGSCSFVNEQEDGTLSVPPGAYKDCHHTRDTIDQK